MPGDVTNSLAICVYISGFFFLQLAENHYKLRRQLMVDPLTLSTIGAVALTEGIKFLYEQAGEVLKRWRERKNTVKDASPQQDKTESVDVKLPDVFEGQFSAPQIHFNAVEQVEDPL